jgi:hypothetical protein
MERTRLPGNTSETRTLHERVGWIGIPTKNRPENLQTCVESFAQCMNEHERQVRFLVMDQTGDRSQLALNAQSVAAIAAKWNVEAWFAGPSEAREYATLLSKHANLPEELVLFACFGDSQYPVNTGANRNMLLLGTAGEMLLQADDDTVCQILPGPEAREGLQLTSEFSCMEYWFPQSGDQSAPSGWAHVDICAVHEELIGRTLSECIKDFGPAEFKSSRWSDTQSLPESLMRRRVLATSLGVNGDSPIPTNLFLLQSDGAQRERLISSESAYRHTLESGQLKRAVRERTISDTGLVSGASFAVDNRMLLPPFSPVQQCEDSVFTALLNACFNECVGFLPWMVRHRRPARHIWSQEITLKRTHLLSGELFWLIIDRLATELTATTPQTRLAQLGKLLIDWSATPAPKFQEMLRGLIVFKSSQNIAVLNRLLQTHRETPEFWAADLKLYRSWIHKAIRDPELDVTDDLIDAFGTSEARVLIQRMVCKFGQLLEIWPELHRAATELHAQGVRVGTKVSSLART